MYEYFAKHHKIQLTDSADMPCLHVGRKKVQYLPLEVCEILFIDTFNFFLCQNAFFCLSKRTPRMLFLCFQLCTLVSLQRYTKALSPTQRASLLDKSRQEPQECIRVLTNVRSPHNVLCIGFSCCNLLTMLLIWQAMRNCRFDSDPLLAACGISIEKQLTQVEGRILEAPRVILNSC